MADASFRRRDEHPTGRQRMSRARKTNHLCSKLLTLALNCNCFALNCFISSEPSLFFLSHFYSNQFGLFCLFFKGTMEPCLDPQGETGKRRYAGTYR